MHEVTAFMNQVTDLVERRDAYEYHLFASSVHRLQRLADLRGRAGKCKGRKCRVGDLGAALVVAAKDQRRDYRRRGTITGVSIPGGGDRERG